MGKSKGRVNPTDPPPPGITHVDYSGVIFIFKQRLGKRFISFMAVVLNHRQHKVSL